MPPPASRTDTSDRADVPDPPSGAAHGRETLVVFGGSFDPPHRTHRRLVEAALDRLAPDRLVVVPCGDHPTKDRTHADARHRVAMCRIAFADLPRVEVSELEIARDGPSYTVDTLRALRASSARDGPEILLLIGSDNLPTIDRWHEADALPDLARLVVFPRADHPLDEERPRLAGRRVDPIVLPCTPDEISSTAVRAALARGARDLPELAPAVEEYAVAHGLYRDDRHGDERQRGDAHGRGAGADTGPEAGEQRRR